MTDIEKRIVSSFIILLEKRQIQQITVTEICAQAGVSKRSFYNYFCDKYDVLLRVQAIPETGEAEAGVSLRTLENYFRDRYLWLLEHRGFLKNLSSYTGQNSYVTAFRDSVSGLLWKIMLQNRPGLEKTPELSYAADYFALGYTLFVIGIILNDPDYCSEYFARESFVEDYIPPILMQYLT